MVEEKENGLSSQEANKKLNQLGPNEIERKEKLSWPKLVFDQLKSPLIYILILAGIITLFLREYTDSVVIFAAVFVNTILGFFQEFKAENSLIALQKLVVPHAWVVRDGEEKYIQANKIVPGDLVVLKTGEKVPADGIITEAVDLYINEALLTGESEPVKKAKNISKNLSEKNKGFMGTVVVSGRGRMLITKTGMKTKMGQIASGLKQTIDEQTPLKEKIAQLSKILAVVLGLICIFILAEGLFKGRDFVEMFTLSVAIAVAAIPEGLVISVTTILALGMQRLLASKALVRRLLAAETLGSVSCICLDKTGTLTEGKMKVVDSETNDPPLLLKAALLCNNLINPLETAMFTWAKEELSKQGKAEIEKVLTKKRVDEIPFSSQKKYLAVLYDDFLFISGAPETILNISNLSVAEKKNWGNKLDNYTKKGYRVVAFAYRKRKKTEKKINEKKFKNFHWLGLLVFKDPVRKEVKPALKACLRAGVKLKVITGDYCQTALAVLRQLDLLKGSPKPGQIMEGDQLEKIPEERLRESINKVVLFCRTTPEQKIKIVEALQANEQIVAMMGDGVNDVLALKKANIGVVVGEASEVAKETADMVLLDSNFKTVLQAIKLGRAVFENIKKVVLYLLSDSFTEVVLVSGSLFLGLPSPLLATQILWVNLVEDGLPGLALAFEPEEDGLLDQPPRRKDAPILDKELKIIIFIIGFVTDFALLGLFVYLCTIGLDINLARTIIFIGLGVDSLFYVFSCKSLHRNIWKTSLFNNMFLNFSVLLGVIMLFGTVYLPSLRLFLKTEPLPFWAFSLLIAFAILKIGIIESVKWFFRR